MSSVTKCRCDNKPVRQKCPDCRREYDRLRKQRQRRGEPQRETLTPEKELAAYQDYAGENEIHRLMMPDWSGGARRSKEGPGMRRFTAPEIHHEWDDEHGNHWVRRAGTWSVVMPTQT